MPDIGADESDGSRPDTFITQKPKKRTRKRTATFRFQSFDFDITGFMCKLDSKPYRPCTSGSITYRRLKRKRHMFRVRATDGFNVDESPAKHGWRVKKRRR